MVEEAQEEDEEETRRTERDLCHEGNAPRHLAVAKIEKMTSYGFFLPR